jgi:hypothetical protein
VDPLRQLERGNVAAEAEHVVAAATSNSRIALQLTTTPSQGTRRGWIVCAIPSRSVSFHLDMAALLKWIMR